MWLGDVQIPDALLDAERDGRLVVFCGAGVSVPPPSRLPTFENIGGVIADWSGVPRRNAEPPDAFLGRVADSGLDVHSRVEEMIVASETQNEVHHAIIRLFASCDSLRVVTTNFDRHLTKAAEGRWPGEVQEFVAPALPLGEAFCGIVYLHGAVGGTPSELVLTDRDFGSAYLTRGYARRFLMDLFSNYVVWFIGYSHRDPVLNYLARGLPPKVERRFALVRSDEADRWLELSVEPIRYQTRRGQHRHRALLAPLSAWGHYVQMGFADHRRRVADIVNAGPSADPEALDYLRGRIRDPDTVPFFCEEATDVLWLQWISTEPVFQALFSRGEPVSWTEVHGALSWWFAQKYVADHHSEAMATVARFQGRLSPGLWQAIAHRLWTQRPSPSHLLAWLPVLLTSAPQQTNNVLDYLLHTTRAGDDDLAAMLLFDFLTDPQPLIQPLAGVFTEDGRDAARIEVGIRGHLYWLDDALEKVIRMRIEAFAQPLLDVVTHHLAKAHTFEVAGRQANDEWDSTSFRPTIEAPEEGLAGLRDWADVLIDAGRDAVDWASANKPELARSHVVRWIASSAPALRRLAIHAIDESAAMGPDERLGWLVEHELLVSISARHEVHRLISPAYASASQEARDAVLAAIDRGAAMGPLASDPDRAARVIYDLLRWLSVASPNDDGVTRRLDQIVEQHPKFREEAVEVEERPSLPSTQELLAKSPTDPEFVEWVLTYGLDEPDEALLFEGRRRSLLQAVSAASSQEPRWGLALGETLRYREEWSTDLWN
jgi:hypothetical protein